MPRNFGLELDLDGDGSFEAGDIDVVSVGIGGHGGGAVGFEGAQGRFVGRAEAEQDLLGRLSWVERNGRFAAVALALALFGASGTAFSAATS